MDMRGNFCRHWHQLSIRIKDFHSSDYGPIEGGPGQAKSRYTGEVIRIFVCRWPEALWRRYR